MLFLYCRASGINRRESLQTMTETIAGVKIPDSKMAKDATDLLRDVATELVFDHSRRVFLFGSLRGGSRGWIMILSCCTSVRCSTTSA